MKAIKEDRFKNKPSRKMLKLHTLFQYASPFAVFALLAYVIGTLFYNPSPVVVLYSRVFLSLFFGLEVLIEFNLYESKKEFVKNYWWRALVVVPAVGFLRIVGQLAQLSQFLSVVKMADKLIDTIRYYIKS